MGRSALLLVSVLVLVFVVVACGGDIPDPSPALELSNGLVSEEEFRALVQQWALDQPVILGAMCSPLASYSPAELMEGIEFLFVLADDPLATPGPRVTPILVRTVSPDEIRAIQMFREECERLT